MREIIAALLCICGFIGAILGISNAYGSYQCKNFHEITGKETRYATLDICYVNTDSGWMRWDEYIKRNVGTEAAKELAK